MDLSRVPVKHLPREWATLLKHVHASTRSSRGGDALLAVTSAPATTSLTISALV